MDRSEWPTENPRVLHLATVPFRPEEGVSRAVTDLSANMIDVDSHLAADRPVGDGFAGLHALTDWRPHVLALSPRLAHVVAEVRPSLVHLHGGILATSLALLPALRGVPVVATVYQLLPVPRHELGWHQILDARHSSVRPARVAASAAFGLPIARRLLKSGRIRVICTPDPRVAAALNAHGRVVMARGGASVSALRATWSDTPTIVFAGRAEPGRGVEELIAAFTIVRARIPGARLRLLLLPGPAGERWRAEHGRRPGIDLVVGTQPDLSAQFAACQVAALPFRIPATITPPLVAAEAMAAGLPVVATGLSCITPMLRHGVNGAIADDLAPVALADALISVIGQRANWERLSSGARRTIESDWSWLGAARSTREAYRYALRVGDGRR